MLRLLPMLLTLGAALLALIDCLARDDDEIRGLPKTAWVFVIMLFPLLGSLAWFFAGRRPRQQKSEFPKRLGGGFVRRDRPRPIAPDDDPEFLRRLGEQRRRADDDDEDKERPGR